MPQENNIRRRLRRSDSNREKYNEYRRSLEYRIKQNLRKAKNRPQKVLLTDAEKHKRKSKKQALRNKKLRESSQFRLNESMRHSINIALKGKKAGRHWEDLVGWSVEECLEHFEKTKLPHMTWFNYGKNGWEWDHIIPQSMWEYEKPEDSEFKQCWSLCNLQPLWAKDNRKKGNKTEVHECETKTIR